MQELTKTMPVHGSERARTRLGHVPDCIRDWLLEGAVTWSWKRQPPPRPAAAATHQVPILHTTAIKPKKPFSKMDFSLESTFPCSPGLSDIPRGLVHGEFRGVHKTRICHFAANERGASGIITPGACIDHLWTRPEYGVRSTTIESPMNRTP